MSTDPSNPAPREALAPTPGCRLRVEAVFLDVAEQHVQAVAAAMIDRANELANLPQCECDVDVSVEWGSAGEPNPRRSPVPAPGRPSEQ